MKKLLLVILLLFSFFGWSQTQGNMITISQIVPSQMTICGDAKQFSVTIYNPSPFTITGDTLFVTIPTGVQYQSGSLTGGTLYNNFGGVLKVLLPNIPTLTSITITYTAIAQCNVISYINGGGSIKNTARVTYMASSLYRFDTNTSSTYLIRQPNLAITGVTNQSYTGNIGDVFTRCITIVNGGLGELSTFTFTDVHAAGIQIDSVNRGVFTQNGLTAKVVLSGTDFMTIGDGDAFFEAGESISICEKVTVINCIAANSSFKAFWGCSVNYCQAAISTANVVFPNYVPNLVVTPTASMNSCFGAGNASPQQLKIVNTGLGKAINFVLDIFQSTSNGYNSGLGSYIDETSITIQTGLTGSASSITPTGTQNTSNLGCMNNNKGKVTLTIPTINSHDTIYIKWNSYSCCFNACTNTGYRAVNGWRYKGTYSNLCQVNYILYEAWGRVYSDIYGALTPDGAPSTLSNGQTGTFNFLFSNYGNSYPVGPGAYWKFEFTLPNYPCLSYSNIRILNAAGSSTWTPNSTSVSGNIVTAIFNTPVPFNLTQAEVKIDLHLACSSCTGTEVLTALSVKSYYIPNNTCGCAIGVSCQSIPFNINCPDPCPAGFLFSDFSMNRTSYGLPDNESNGGNGIPDGSGSLNFSRIKTNRAMFGDTITSVFYGVVNTDMSHPSLQYAYATSSISNGNLLNSIDANLKIYRSGSLIYTCNNISPTVSNSGTTRDFTYDVSVPTLITNGCLPGGYTNTQNDSLVLTCRYKVTTNVGNATPLNCFSTNKFYLSAIANPTSASDKLQCGTINGNSTVIGYWFRNWEGNYYGVKSCDDATITQNYFLSIGPGFTNDAGGNLFPYEYRNWAHIQTLTAVVPPGYTFISATVKDVRTAGTLATSTTGPLAITPVDSTSDTLVFNIEPLFQGYGGSIPLSDDGFYGVFNVVVEPSCEVVPDTEMVITHDMKFQPASYLTGPGSDTTFLRRTDDVILYDGPDLFLQSPLPSVLAVDSLVTWDVILSNSSNVADAMHTWLASSGTTGVSIVKMVDLGTNLPITPNSGGVYPVGTMPAMGTRTFRITARYTSCDMDSLIVYCGWNCHAGYPSTLQTYPCTPIKIHLDLTPLMPGFMINATGPTAPIQLCDTATYVAECFNIQLGAAYHVKLKAILPSGAIMIPGSSQISYPDSSTYINISDPVSLGNNQWQWNISALDSLINVNGIKGLLDTSYNIFKVKFKVSTGCGYVSGSNLNFIATGVAVCGDTTEAEVFQGPDLDIIGLDEPYSTTVKIVTDYISPCATNSVIRLVVSNHGPTSFGNTDSVSFKLPSGVSFVPGSFVSIHNSPSVGTPVLSTISGVNYLTWRLPPGVIAGDSTVFSFQFAGEPLLLSCGIVTFEAKSVSSNVVVCSVTGNNCATNIITGDTLLPVFIYKAYLSFDNGSAVSVPNPPGGETVTMTFDITNVGQAIETHADSVIQYFFDADGNGIYSVADIFISQDTVIVPRDSTITYTTIFDAPAGQACAILAVVDPGVNNCVCDPTQLLINATLKSLGNDTVICSASPFTMSLGPVTGYTYNWTPSTGLNDSTASDAILTPSNTTNSPIATTYYLSTDRIGCNAIDTIAITVNPLPTATVTGTITVCKDAPSPNVIFTGAVGVAPYTFTYTINGGAPLTAISTGDTSVIPAVTSNPGTFIYKLVSVQDSSVANCLQLQTDSVIVTVSPLPTVAVEIIGDSAVCQGGPSLTVAFIGSGGVAPYTYTYSINGGVDQTVVSTNGDTAFVSVPTSIGGPFTYKVSNIQDGSITTCSQAQSDSVTVTINPLPQAIIAGAAAVCKDATPPLITFIGTTGTAPFTFTYHVNGGADTTIMSTSGDTAFVPAPTVNPGTLVYTLVSVQDSSSTSCFQPQSGSVTITVDPLPTATLTGSGVICQYSTQPTLVFTGHGGVAPYNFIYTLNGVTQPQISSVGSDSVITVVAPTNDTGTFVYALVSVQDANIAQCTHPQTGNASIQIHPKPIAAFTTNIVCNGNATQFTDGSSTAGGTLNSWNWDLGENGTTNATQNPSYMYAGAGNFDVTLIVSNTFGCTDTLQQAVQVYYNPVVNFTHSDVCFGDTIYFTNTSTIDSSTAISGYIWVFGDGSPTNNLTNPSHYYNNAGSYNVTLVATSIDGCSGVTNLTAKAFDAPTSAVQYINTCLFDSALFTNTSINPTMGTISSWSWNFGDGSALDTSHWSPLHRFPNPGDYEFTLITHSSNLGCPDTLTDSITVYPMPIADYQSTDVCLFQTMSFFDSSTVSLNDVTQWQWNFGDSSAASTLQNPTHDYTSASTFAATLICTTTNGCKDTVTHNVVVHPLPNVIFNSLNVCDGTNVSFVDATTIANTDALYSWTWEFGDTSAASTTQNTTHLYPDAGSYIAQLTVSSTFGCVDSVFDTIVVNPNPVVNFTLSSIAGCEPFCITLKDSSSIISGANTNWMWSFGDFSTPVSGDTATHCYNNDSITATVTYTPSLTVTSDSGCVTTNSKPNAISVYPKPAAIFSVDPTSETIVNAVFTLTDASIGTDIWNWDFGDSDTSSNPGPTLSHEYADTGHYTITLVASTVNNCADTSYQHVIVEPDFVFYIPNSFTPNDDGINDIFNGKGEFIIQFEMSIFDRWGNLLFHSDDYHKGWDGRANNGKKMAQRDVYVYLINITDIFNNEHTYRGTVTLVN